LVDLEQEERGVFMNKVPDSGSGSPLQDWEKNAKLLQSADTDTWFRVENGKLRKIGAFERVIINIKNFFDKGKTLRDIDRLASTQIANTFKEITLRGETKTYIIDSVPQRYRNAVMKALAQESKETPLMLACREQDAKKVGRFLKAGGNINEKNSYGQTALHIACQLPKNKAIIELLLLYNADVNAKDAQGDTPFIKAARARNEETLDLLAMEPDIDLQAENKDKETAATIVSRLGSKDVFEKIQGYKKPSEQKLQEQLLQACSIGSKERVRKLINNGADINGVDRLEVFLTPLGFACASSRSDIVEELVKLGVDINKSGRIDKETPLMVACRIDNEKSVKILIEHGADVNALSILDETALMYAAQNGNSNIVTILLKQDVPRVHKDIALIKACGSEMANLDVVKALVQAGANVNYQLLAGKTTALMNAVLSKKNEVVAFLIESGANLELMDQENRTALVHACIQNDKELVELLLDKGANPEHMDVHNNTAFTYAKGHPEIERLLKEKMDRNKE
jgi:ankyrin repeat protein